MGILYYHKILNISQYYTVLIIYKYIMTKSTINQNDKTVEIDNESYNTFVLNKEKHENVLIKKEKEIEQDLENAKNDFFTMIEENKSELNDLILNETCPY